MHCRRFAPTWEKLVGECEAEIPSVHLAQVNCAVHGDLCDANGVKGYPTIFMYEDGKMVEEYRGNRDLADLKVFLKRHAEAEVSIKEIEEEPQPVLNTNGEVLSIHDSATFVSTLEQGPAFIKFYAPWCGHCKKLAPSWVQLAAHLRNKVTVAEVDCDAQSSLCAAQKIQGYPTLIYFANGVRSEYAGGRRLDQLRTFAETASVGRLHPLNSDSELKTLVAEHDVLYLFLYSTSNPEVVKTAREASAPLLGSPPVYTSHSQDLFARYGVPSSASWALIAFKDRDADKSAGHLHGSSNTPLSAMKEWFLTHRIPSFLELSSDSFQSVMNAPQEPLVVIAAVPEHMQGRAKARLEQLAREWKGKTGGSGELNGKEVVFTWMDTERWKDWLKSMYGIKKYHDEAGLEDIRVVIADHKQLVYHDEDISGHKIKLTSTQKLFATLEKATAGKLHYKHSQNVVERLARYLNHKLAGIEYYVTLHPYKTVLFIVGGIAVVFYLLFRWLGSDMPNDRDYYKSARLD
ncbi:protein disulfide isomerase [Macrolepiota fuliginosa MF-IS2]|uniref:Protein disulfide isomerase n=1 Tax=Macrolepiota fuliginosa MF-IS2 TaxID=1400762 RepID=A0A9P6C9I4_9AGAR|nr:protein disulfide isomerase [Macrolepiota fuliginosa MF-IS2]